VSPGEFVEISVTDQGTGIDQETLDHIFEPFFTTKEVGKGSGLGLAQVYGFMRSAGGFIGVETQKGEGTTFRLFLPRSEGEAGRNSHLFFEPAAAETGRYRRDSPIGGRTTSKCSGWRSKV
jgi:K+-sensing histidine kinase KdpD